MGPTRHALRAATQAIHDRLDQAPVLRPLAGPGLTVEDYRAALVALHGVHAPVEERLGGGAGRLDLLRADLGDLGVDAAALPVMGGLPDLGGTAERLAARYVLDGSAHGGRAMLPNVTRALGFDAARGARFLASAGIDAAAGWRDLLARLEADIDSPAARERACATAVSLFTAIEIWLTKAGWAVAARRQGR